MPSKVTESIVDERQVDEMHWLTPALEGQIINAWLAAHGPRATVCPTLIQLCVEPFLPNLNTLLFPLILFLVLFYTSYKKQWANS